MTIVLMIRHGDNDMVGKRLAGRQPGVHLNQNGRKQADALAQFLGQSPIKAIYSSPMERAVETAEPLASRMDLPIQFVPELTEMDYGSYQNKTFRQLARYKLWRALRKDTETFRFPGGESFQEIQQRSVKELEQISGLWSELDIVACFTHADIVRLAVAHYLGIPIKEYHRLSANTASITVIQLNREHPKVLHSNLLVPPYPWQESQLSSLMNW